MDDAVISSASRTKPGGPISAHVVSERDIDRLFALYGERMQFGALALVVAFVDYLEHPQMTQVLAAVSRAPRSPQVAQRLAARFVPYNAGKPGRVEKLTALLRFFARGCDPERLLSPALWVDSPPPRKPRGDGRRDEAAGMVVRLGLGLCLRCEQGVDTSATDSAGRVVTAFYCRDCEATADPAGRRRDRARMSRVIKATDTRRCLAVLSAWEPPSSSYSSYVEWRSQSGPAS